MTAQNGNNGGWPDLPRIPPDMESIPEIPDAGFATREDRERFLQRLVKVMGSTLLTFGQLWPRVVDALEHLRLRVDHNYPPILPPYRERTDSIHDQAENVSHDVVAQVRAYESNPSTPPGPAPDEVMERILKERVSQALDARDAAKWRAVEMERKKAEEERIALEAKNKLDREALATLNQQARDEAARKFKFASYTGAVTTTLGIIAWLIEHFTK